MNNIFRENPGDFSGYSLWYFDKEGKRSDTMNMKEIPANIIAPGLFIFFGKLVKTEDIDVEDILAEFDRLLPIYKTVETDNNEDFDLLTESKPEEEFVFNKDKSNLVFNKDYSFVEKQINIDVRHSEIQARLKKELKEKYGEENVSLEHSFRGNRIDAVVKQNNSYIFYEVKTASTVKSCIRQAIGQLLEYSFWPGQKIASKLVVVGEPHIKEKGKKYLSFLNNELNIPIEYLRIDISS